MTFNSYNREISNDMFISEDLGKIITHPNPIKEDDETHNFVKKKQFLPNELYQFPVTEFGKAASRKLKFQGKWLLQFHWLSYSVSLDGAFCRFCVFFRNQEVGKGSHQTVNTLVVSPFKKWKDALEIFKHHDSLDYHKTETLQADNFCRVYEKKNRM